MAGRSRRAAPGEPACGVDGCPRPAGLGTWHVGAGPCLRHGGDRWSPPKEPPGWWGTGEATPYATLLRRLAAAKLAAQPFPLAWAGALYDALYGLPADDFREWAGVLPFRPPGPGSTLTPETPNPASPLRCLLRRGVPRPDRRPPAAGTGLEIKRYPHHVRLVKQRLDPDGPALAPSSPNEST